MFALQILNRKHQAATSLILRFPGMSQKLQHTHQRAMITAYLKQTGRQLLQFLLQLIPDLRQTLTLSVLEFQFLKCEGDSVSIIFSKDEYLHCQLFFSGQTILCQHEVGYNTLFAASSCSLRISEPFSLISFSLISSEELRSLERLPWSLPEVGRTWPPASTLVSGSGSRSTNLERSRNILVLLLWARRFSHPVFHQCFDSLRHQAGVLLIKYSVICLVMSYPIFVDVLIHGYKSFGHDSSADLKWLVYVGYGSLP